jgi:hypothetical protein
MSHNALAPSHIPSTRLPPKLGTIRIAVRSQGLWRVWTGPSTGWEYFQSPANATIFAKALLAIQHTEKQT